eukprot:2025494-Pyramimonas_sp.AAC.1
MRMSSGISAIGRAPPSALGMKTIMVAWAPSAWGRSSHASRRSRHRNCRATGSSSSCRGWIWSAPRPAVGE